MVFLEWWSADRLVAAAAVGQLIILIAAALFARAQVREARVLREDQARPFVVVDLEPAQSPPLLILVVANLGKTMARNVRIEVDPPLVSTVYDSLSSPIGSLKLFTEPIPSLVPGRRIELLFDSLAARTERELPDSYRVRLTYDGEGGRAFTDEQRLDLDLYRAMRMVWRDTVHDVSKTLKTIEGYLGRWSASGGGLLVQSPEDRRQRIEDLLAAQSTLAWPATTAGQGTSNGRPGLKGRLLEVVGRLRGEPSYRP